MKMCKLNSKSGLIKVVHFERNTQNDFRKAYGVTY